jgi:hypothetical protein
VLALAGCDSASEPARSAELPTGPPTKGSIKSIYKDYNPSKTNTSPRRGREK